jgi:hypothetical protein
MHLRFEYTFNEYVEANTKRSLIARISNATWAIATPIVILGFIIIVFDKARTPSSPKESVLSYLPILIFFILMSPWGRRILIYMRWKQQPALYGVIDYQISEEAIVVTTQTSKSELGWETFTKFIETKNLFMLYSGRLLFYLIPKRAFADADEVAQFREMAKRRVQSH